MTAYRFSRRLLAASASILLVTWSGHSQTVEDDSLFAPSLGRVKHFRVLLPQDYTTEKRFPALVLLHGFTGNYRNWLEDSKIGDEVRGLPLILVFPDAENSWYVNQVRRPAEKFEDYIVRDVLGRVRQKYGIDTTRIGVGGLSMGGYGAIILGLRHPDVFSFVAGLSASLDLPEGIPDLEKHGRGGFRATIDTALGDRASEQWIRYNPFALVEGLDSARAPYLYLANGIQDEFEGRLDLYREFADALRRHHMAYEYHETPGKHNWEYWDREMRSVILRLSELWGLPRLSNPIR